MHSLLLSVIGEGSFKLLWKLLDTSLCVKGVSSGIVCRSLLSSIKGAEHDSEFVGISEVLFWLQTLSHALLLSKLIYILASQKTLTSWKK